jgi:hypothetical protein
MLRLLLKFWLYPVFGMFWAAGAVADAGMGGGGGAGDGAGLGDAGDAGGDGAADSGGADDADLGGGDDAGDLDASGSGADADANASADPNALVDSGDGRKIPGKIKKLFEAAKAGGFEKEAKQFFFGLQRLNKVIPGGINGAIELARSVEEFGGVEGVQALQSDLQSHQESDELFSRADPRWVESGFTENPESALKLFTHSLDYVAEHHPEQYDHLMAKVIINDLGAAPVHEIHALLSSLKDNAQAQALAKKLAEYYNSRNDTAKKTPEKKPDAQNKALTDREAKLEKQTMDLRFTQVNNEVFPQMKSDVTKTLQAQAKLGGIDLGKLAKDYPAEWRGMLNEIHQEIMKAATKDQRFIDKHYALVKKGDIKRAAAAVNAKHAAIIPDIARRVMQNYGVFRGKKANGAAGNKGAQGDRGNQGNAGNAGNANQGWTKVSARPQNGTIDWSKTTSAMQLDGKYILNDGKKVVVQY